MMMRKIIAGSCAGLTAGALAFGGTAFAQPRWAGSDLQTAVERSCVVEISSSAGRIELQNLCYNPRAVRINWGDGRLVDDCLNSSGDVRFVAKLADSYRMVREQDILLCQ